MNEHVGTIVKGAKFYICKNESCDFKFTQVTVWVHPPKKCPKCNSDLVEDS